MNAYKVVIVDDEAAIRRLLKTALERAGYCVVETASAREAISARARFDISHTQHDMSNSNGGSVWHVSFPHRQYHLTLEGRRTAVELEPFITKPFSSVSTELAHKFGQQIARRETPHA